MAVIRFLARLFGWLLTPLVAWAASFLGATVMAYLSRGWGSVRWSLYATVFSGATAAAVVLLLWLKLLRRSPKLQETLQLAPDATPLVVAEAAPFAEDDEKKEGDEG